MQNRFNFAYAVIEKATNRCCQTIATNTANWNLNNEEHYSVHILVDYYEEYLNKYYYNNQWWERQWSEVDEYGEPVEGATYIDIPWNVGE